MTVGHGTLSEGELVGLLRQHAVTTLIDVRTAPGSRRHPQFGRHQLAVWLPAAGVEYAWEGDLGGFRKPATDSANVALRNASFRGYADYMATTPFRDAIEAVRLTARRTAAVVMCSETLWWRCHRRLIADFCTLVHGDEVVHLAPGAATPHRLTQGVRADGRGGVVYDGGSARLQGP
jgi:uncharacterized protein (DUF488 family)